jgi:tRNA nucleotidyltransferase (CCA-adding enzyme)
MLSKKIENHLLENDFKVLKIDPYYREGDDFAYIIIMLDSLVIPKFKFNLGPKVTNLIHSESFINNSRCILGPYIKEDRWYSIKKRNKVFVKPILMDFLFNNFKLPIKIYVDKEIRELYLKQTNISYYFSKFFLTKEDFLI